jgi:hypothetical protein
VATAQTTTSFHCTWARSKPSTRLGSKRFKVGAACRAHTAVERCYQFTTATLRVGMSGIRWREARSYLVAVAFHRIIHKAGVWHAANLSGTHEIDAHVNLAALQSMSIQYLESAPAPNVSLGQLPSSLLFA